jgi:hypothetical protein
MAEKKRFLLVLGVIMLISLACSLPGLSSIAATDTPEPTHTQRPTRTDRPTETPEAPTFTPRPTYTATPEYTATRVPEPYYLDELEGDVNRWFPAFVPYGDENGYAITQDATGLLFTINTTDTYVYLVNTEYTYRDVQLDAQATNYGYNNNNITLLCRYSDAGWYEVNAFSNGYYHIYKFDSNGAGYVELKNGGIISLLTGRHENHFTMICQGTEIVFIVNDREIARLSDTTFSEGSVGLSVSSYDIVPVDVHFEWVQVSQP